MHPSPNGRPTGSIRTTRADVHTLADQFERAGSEVIHLDDLEVRAVARFPVRDGARLRVHRLGCSRARRQALKLMANEGTLETNGKRAAAVTLWSNTAPRETLVIVHGSRVTLDIWNAWMYGGVEHSWLGNAGMILEGSERGYTIRCSDGVGPVDFDDLVVAIDFLKPA